MHPSRCSTTAGIGAIVYPHACIVASVNGEAAGGGHYRYTDGYTPFDVHPKAFCVAFGGTSLIQDVPQSFTMM